VSIVVTGGAGYIGSHVVRLLRQRGEAVTVIDDLSAAPNPAASSPAAPDPGGLAAYAKRVGDPNLSAAPDPGGLAAYAKRVGDAALVVADVADPAALPRLVEAMSGADAVIHFAARKQVAESVARPAWYFAQNVGGLANVLAAMEKAGVGAMVFSSSAAVYGPSGGAAVTEDAPLAPINPYGETKVVGESMLDDAAASFGLRRASLRYFNVAGVGWSDLADLGRSNLVPMVLERLAAGQAPVVFGDDYPTPDGTCIRDYVHVLDVAEAHVAALDYLARPDRPDAVFNVGTGRGASVREVIAALGGAAGRDVVPAVAQRRPGDPAQVVADPPRIAEVMGWRSRLTLEDIAASAVAAWPWPDPARAE
jgi:UDP-glucose 4-epimerase